MIVKKKIAKKRNEGRKRENKNKKLKRYFTVLIFCSNFKNVYVKQKMKIGYRTRFRFSFLKIKIKNKHLLSEFIFLFS